MFKQKRQGRSEIKRALEHINENEVDQKTGIAAIYETLQKIVRNGLFYIIESTKQFMISLYLFHKKDIFNIFDVASITLSILMISHIIRLYSSSFRHGYEAGDSYEDYIGEFAEYNRVYTTYQVLSAVNSLIIFMRLLQYFKFSKQLSLLTDILDSAALDIFFFWSMFVVILVSYALMGYILFGHEYSDFNEIGFAITTCYSMLLGTYDRDKINKADAALGMVFFVSFMIVFNLLLLNMFIAIVGAHFKNLRPSSTQGVKIEGFFTKLYNVCSDKFCKKNKEKRMHKGHNAMREESKATEKDTNSGVKQVKQRVTENDLLWDPRDPMVWRSEIDRVQSSKSGARFTLDSLNKHLEVSPSEENEFFPPEKQDLQFLCSDEWEEMDSFDKARFWRGLFRLHEKQLQIKQEMAYINSQKFKIESFIPDQLLLFWEHLEPKDKLELWIGDWHLNDEERIAIWNSVVFHKEKISEFSSLIDWTPKTLRNIWANFSLQDRVRKAELIIAPVRKRIAKLSKMGRDMHKKPPAAAIQYILKKKRLVTDERLMLWTALSYIENSKFSLYLNQPLKKEADLIQHLLLAEEKDNIFQLENSDHTLSCMLDTRIFDKIVQLAEFQAKLASTNKFKVENEKIFIDIASHDDFKQDLKKRIKALQAEIRKAKERVDSF